MTNKSYTVCDRQQTAHLIDFPSLVAAIETAASEYAAGEIISPERMVVPLPRSGVMLSMPAVAADIAAHKLVCVHPENKMATLPTIHGQVSVSDSSTGQPLFILNGPEVTGRRTAAVSMLGIRTLMPGAPGKILLIGTGTQADYHLKAIAALFPETEVRVRGRTTASATEFCIRHSGEHSRLGVETPGEESDVVITLTTSLSAVYNEPPALHKLIIGVGAFRPEMAEIGSTTLSSSLICVDDPAGAKHEAGDLIQADINWENVVSLADVLNGKATVSGPVVFKTVGTGAWDLAACRVAYKNLGI